MPYQQTAPAILDHHDGPLRISRQKQRVDGLTHPFNAYYEVRP